jgi:hypothetical protein
VVWPRSYLCRYRNLTPSFRSPTPLSSSSTPSQGRPAEEVHTCLCDGYRAQLLKYLPLEDCNDLLKPPDVLVKRDFDDDISLFSARRVRNIEATDSFLADARRSRAKQLREKRQSAQQERRRQGTEHAIQEAKKRAYEARMAQQIVVSLNICQSGPNTINPGGAIHGSKKTKTIMPS